MKMMLYYLSVLFLVLMDYEQRDAFFFSKFSDKGTEDGLFLSFFLPTAIVIFEFYLCNPVKSAGGRTLGMTDR